MKKWKPNRCTFSFKKLKKKLVTSLGRNIWLFGQLCLSRALQIYQIDRPALVWKEVWHSLDHTVPGAILLSNCPHKLHVCNKQNVLVTCLSNLSNWQPSPCVERGLTFCTSLSLCTLAGLADLSNWHLRPCNQCGKGLPTTCSWKDTVEKSAKQMQPVWKGVASLLTNHVQLF